MWPMSGTVIWALLNGLITGGIWVGIVLLRRQRRQVQEQCDLLAELRQHLDDRENLAARLVALEERLDLAERLLASQRERPRLEGPPPDDD
jgi:uncharacterized membrane-anchored protein YhcB (DUF1043 family)